MVEKTNSWLELLCPGRRFGAETDRGSSVWGNGVEAA